MNKNKVIAIIKAVLSTFVWGLGQLFNRQWIKALMFFTVFALVITLEVTSGSYGEELHLYDDKVPGEEMPSELSNGFIQEYYYNMFQKSEKDPYSGIRFDFNANYTDYTFLQLVAEENGMTLEVNPWYVTFNDRSSAAIDYAFDETTASIVVENDEKVSWNAQLVHGQLYLENEKEYQVTFDVSSDVPGNMEVELVINEDTILVETVAVTDQLETYTVNFTVDGYTHNGKLVFDFDGTVDAAFRNAVEANLVFDNVSMSEYDGTNVVADTNQIQNGDFSSGPLGYTDLNDGKYYTAFIQEDGTPLPEDDFSQVRIDSSVIYEYIAQQLIIVEEDAELGGVGNILEVAEEMAEEFVVNKAISSLLEDSLTYLKGEDGWEELRAATAEAIAIAELEEEGHTVGEANWDNTLQSYIDSNEDALLKSADDQLSQERYDEVYEDEWDTYYNKAYKTNYANKKEQFYFNLYGEFAKENEGVNAFITYINDKFSNNNLGMDTDDVNKMLMHIYYLVNPVNELDDPEEDVSAGYDTLFARLDNFYYEQGGFFVKGIWGLVTMGETELISITGHKELSFFLPESIDENSINYQEIIISGHHSIQLLLNGVITAIAIFFVAILWIWNIRDAYNTSIQMSHNGNKRIGEREYFKKLYHNSFEYIVLSPAVVVIAFISLMPIIFGILVAFTNYNIDNLPPGNLVSWVGFDNFIQLFSVTSGSTIDFGGQFWGVFGWTLIWAVGATFTCFFGGFLQAVIISNKRVVFRKAWRSVLILPWAVPALISQMIFRVMFQDNGYVNEIMAKIGITEWFTDLGFIGKTYQEAMAVGPIERFFHMGTNSFEWLSNEANPWFVRIFLIVLNVWLGFPFFMALMSGVMTSIDKSLYEAASIDGATGFQQFRFITLPLVLIATSPLLVMTFSGNFNNFGVIYFITGGGPGAATFSDAFAGKTDILISWIYKLTTDDNIKWFNMASVFSVLIFLIIGSVSAWNFTRTRAFREDD